MGRSLGGIDETLSLEPRSLDPATIAILNKGKLLDDEDRKLLIGFVDLLVARSRR